ncbi:peptide ABC transporter substrate-binding protein [Beijerinckia sp. L45]|uniref:peptide ABC transporter substrate-binding protein n=1 Tax=Beijerinckia sp. L45 TaxID=1641855 RepID=UPI001FED7341|nr:peptide ABC transporter substrate-binding protein [Beijerinckia sp. L45]
MPHGLKITTTPTPAPPPPRKGKGIAATLLCLLPALFLLAAPARADTIWRRGETADPGSLDPAKTSTVVEAHILDELLEGLVTYDNKGVLKPGVAARWDVSADGLIYTFHLRPDARWSNGAPVTADDFVFSFRRLMDPKTGAGYANILYTVKNAEAVNTGKLPVETLGIRALDPATCEITLERPTAYFLAQLTHFTAQPVYPPSVAQYGDAFARAGRLVSNGAFRLKSYLPNDALVLEKNPYFHDAAEVALDGEIILPLEDQSAALRRFLAGEIDSYDGVPVDQIAFVRAHLPDAFKVAPSLGSYFYAFDTKQKPFDDIRVRKALSLVIDREFLANSIWGGTMLPGYSFVPPGMAGYGAPSTTGWKDESPFDREDEAKRLMAAAGYGPEHPLQLTFRMNQSENHKATAVAVADMWAVLGVRTTFIVTDATTHYAFLASKQPFDVVRSGWFADYPDAQNYLFLAESDNPGLNYAQFSDPTYDALMHDAAVQPDAGERQKILHKAEAVLLAQLPYLPLMTYQAANLVSPKLRGWETNVIDHHPGRYVSKVE